MREDTIHIRHLGMAILLYLLGPAIILSVTLGLITHNGSQLIDWVMTTSSIASPMSQGHGSTYNRTMDIGASKSTVTQSSAQALSSKSPHSGLALNSVTRRQSRRASEDQGYTEPFDRTVQMRPDGRFSLSNVSGDITVKSWDRAEVHIQAKKVARTDDEEEGKEALALVTIEVDEHGGNVDVRTVYPDRRDMWGGRRTNVSVFYEVTVPEKASVRLNSVSGSIDVTALRGDVAARSVSGSVVLTDITSRVRGESVSGDIVANRLNGDADLITVSGDIDAQEVKGDLDARTTSGRVVLRDVTASRLSAQSTSGTVSLEGPIVKGGTYELETVSGGIRLTVPSNAAFDLRAQAFSGSIDTDLPITLRGTVSSGHGRRHSLNGTVNGGGALVALSAVSGHIQIRYHR